MTGMFMDLFSDRPVIYMIFIRISLGSEQTWIHVAATVRNKS